MSDKVSFAIGFDPEDAQQIRLLAARAKITPSQWIRQCALLGIENKLGKVECEHVHVVKGVCWSCWEYLGADG